MAENDAAPATKPPDPGARRLEWVKAVGMPVVTLLVTLVGGYYFNNLVKDREARESNERVYAQLLTQREQSDALIRKEMLNLVVSRFFSETKKGDLNAQVLQLELLANNFNQSLDLAPLFKELARRLSEGGDTAGGLGAELKKRLDVSAATLIYKQVTSLGRRGYVKEASVPIAKWETDFGRPFIDERIPFSRVSPLPVPGERGAAPTVRLRVEVIDVNMARHEVEVRLRVDLPGSVEQDVDRHFWVSAYDFPMLDNTQLPYGLRCSVVITDFFVPEGPAADRDANSFVKFHLVVFPAASASFKERQDYDDVLLDMLRSSSRTAAPQGEPS